MADTLVYSTDQANMRDYALWVQAPSGATAYPWTVGDLRTLITPATPQSGVSSPDDFVVTTSSPGTVTVSGGVGVVSPAGISGASAQERYVFAATGPVDVPIPANSGGTTLHHRLVAQVDDQQLAMGAANTVWAYRLLVDDGTPPASNGVNSIGLATIQVNPGQSSGYSIADIRDPCAHECGVTLSRDTSLDVPNGVGVADRDGIHLTVQDYDPWNMATINTGGTQFFLRHPGIWDVQITAFFAGVTTWCEIGIGINGVANLITSNKANAVVNGQQLTATATGVKIIPTSGYYLEPYSLAGNTGVSMTTMRFAAYRRVYQAD